MRLAAFPKELRNVHAPIIRAPPLVSKYCGVRDIRIVDCSRTLTGTVKDYRSIEILRFFHFALRRDYDSLVVYEITYGNSGYSMGKMAQIYNRHHKAKVHVVNIVDANLNPTIKARLAEVSEVVETDLSAKVLNYKERLALAQRSNTAKSMRAARMNPYEMEPELFSALFEVGFYKRLVCETRKFDANAILMPVGSGELYYNFALYHPAHAAMNRMPHAHSPILGVTVAGNARLSRGRIPSIADKLVSPVTSYIRHPSRLDIVEEGEIREAYAVLQRAGIRAEPSAAVAFAGATKIDKDARLLVISTGYGLF